MAAALGREQSWQPRSLLQDVGIELQVTNASCSKTVCDRTPALLKAVSHSLLADLGH